MIFKIHYGLWYGGLVGVIPFLFNYAAEYSGATATQHGILYTVLPFVALLAKPAICSIADKYAAHHHCLLFFIFTTILGYGSLAIYPFFPDLVQNHKNLIWVFYCVAALIGNTSMCIVNSIGDSLAINSCQKKDVSYGEYRLWGPVGFGIFGAIWGIADEIPSMPKYTPGIITMVLILSTNSLLIAFWYDKAEFKVLGSVIPQVSDPNSPTNQNYGSTNIDQRLDDGGQVMSQPKVKRLSLLWKLCRQQGSIFAYIFLFTFCGVMTGIHWQFFFKYLEQVAKDKDQKFSIIATLALPVQALGGELVFFMLSGKILKKLGASLTLVVCLFSFAARYLSYAYLIPKVSIYWILMIELLQGPAFGLMYCVLTHQANYYSGKIDEIVIHSSNPGDVRLKNSLHATLQGVLGASFEGLGLGLGAIIGGRAYDIDPLLMWQIAGFGALLVATFCLVAAIFSPVMQTSDINDNSHSLDHTTDLMNNGDEDDNALEELRRIARSCQSEHGRPSMRDVRTSLEDLLQKVNNNTSVNLSE